MKLTKLMVIAVITCLASALLWPSMANAKISDNDALNQFYAQFTSAFEHLDAEIIKTMYAENACYIPEQQSKDITIGRDNIIALYHAFFSRIKHKKAHIEVDFRVIERQISDNSATDIGYYLIRFYPPKETEEPVSEFAGKFVIVSKKKEDGKWYLTVDTNNRAEPDFYYQAKPSPNLYFGSHFTQIEHN